MLFVALIFLFKFFDRGDTQDDITPRLVHINDLKNVAYFKDAQHRGPAWYDFSAHSHESESDLDSAISSNDGQASDEFVKSSDKSSGASSRFTNERRKVTDLHRDCTGCPHEMMKHYKNIGIKWICGGYQRARRTFKSECMMRYRNCQDGTMFVKIHDYKCGLLDDLENTTLPYHGKHWFYDYKV